MLKLNIFSSFLITEPRLLGRPAHSLDGLPNELHQLLMYIYTVFIVQAYQTSQYVVPRGCIFLGKWHSSFARS
jgi:hypothetical protein